jgi:hypothetical protein
MAYKVFQNGFPLPASDLNNFLMNQSVISFANSTLRDATITDPVEGMVTYLEDDNKLYKFTGLDWELESSPITTEGDLIVGGTSGVTERLPVGTNNQVLTVVSGAPSWEDAAGGGTNWSVLASGVVSGVSSLNLTGFAAKDKLMLLVQTSALSNNYVETYVRFNSSSSGYKSSGWAYLAASSYNPNLMQDVNETSYVPLWYKGGGNYSGNANLLVTGANSAGLKTYQFVGGIAGNVSHTDNRSRVGGGSWNNSSSITSVQLIVSGGTFSSGDYQLLGSD